jgi:hypothetical protein
MKKAQIFEENWKNAEVCFYENFFFLFTSLLKTSFKSKLSSFRLKNLTRFFKCALFQQFLCRLFYPGVGGKQKMSKKSSLYENALKINKMLHR